MVDLVRKNVDGAASTSIGFELTAPSPIWVTLWYHADGGSSFTYTCQQYVMQPPPPPIPTGNGGVVARMSYTPPPDPPPADSEFVNLALNQSASQSTGAPAGKAVDGNTDMMDPLVMDGSFPWWQVDLGGVQYISDVELYSGFGNWQWLWIFISPTPFGNGDTVESLAANPKVWNNGVQGFSPASVRAIPVNTVGRYVRVQLSGIGTMSLCEVQVHGVALDQ
jgi:hypothetical protein